MYGNLSISGPYNICDELTAYTIDNLPAGTPITWSVSPDIHIVSKQNNSVTVKRDPNLFSMNPTAYIIADIGEPVNRSIENNAVIVWKGGVNRSNNLIDISSSPNEYGNPYRHTAQLKGDLLYRLSKSPRWSVSDGLVLTFNDGTMIQFEGELLQGKCIAVDLINPCGEPTQIIHRFNNNMSEYYPFFSLFPNPATDQVTLNLSTETSKNVSTLSGKSVNKTPPSGIIEIQLWSATSLLRTYKTDRNTYQISVSDLPKGMYFVRVIKDGETHTQKLLKK